MIVRLEVTPETKVKVIQDDEEGCVLELEPTFTKRAGTSTLLTGAAKSNGGKLLDRFSLTVSGKTGKIGKATAAETVTPAVDDTSPGKADETDEKDEDEK